MNRLELRSLFVPLVWLMRTLGPIVLVRLQLVAGELVKPQHQVRLYHHTDLIIGGLFKLIVVHKLR